MSTHAGTVLAPLSPSMFGVNIPAVSPAIDENKVVHGKEIISFKNLCHCFNTRITGRQLGLR